MLPRSEILWFLLRQKQQIPQMWNLFNFFLREQAL